MMNSIYYTYFSNQLGRIMIRNSSLKMLSRSSSTSSHHNGSKPSFRTLLKRRNDTIPASQLYQDLPGSHSQTRILAQSQVLCRVDAQNQKMNQLDIRDYVRNMTGKKEPIIDRRQVQHVPNEVTDAQNSRIILRPPKQHSSVIDQTKIKENKENRSIEELQNKIESFVNQNMRHLKVQRGNMGLSKWSQLRKGYSIDKEMEDICQYFNDLTIQMGYNENQDEKLRDLNKKIQMLQKMLAAQNTQSEILKLQYYGLKNQRQNTTSFSSKQLLSNASRLNRQNKPLNIKRDHCQKAKQVNILSSTSKSSFMKPNKSYYLTSKEKKNTFSLNRQPIPRSSYSAQYLNYGYIPTYSYKSDNIRQSPETPLAIKASTYQKEYKQKLGLVNKVNFKELDCFNDKLKNTKISFMNSSKKPSFQCALNLKLKLKNYSNVEQIKQNISLVIPRKGLDSNLNRFMNLTSTDGFYTTSAQKQFNLHNTILAKENEDLLKSEIKNKKLDHLKQAFKNLASKN